MFPTDQGASVSGHVSKIIQTIRDSGHPYQLTSMGTVIETSTVREALDVVEQAYQAIEGDCDRIYSALKFDIRKGEMGRMHRKVESVQSKIGGVNT